MSDISGVIKHKRSIIESKNLMHENSKSEDLSIIGSANIIESSHLQQVSKDQRENLLIMGDYRILGFLEYFLAPIIFPAFLSFWALTMLVVQVLC